MGDFSFKIERELKGKNGRAGLIKTPHGNVETPAFVTVGTKGTVKALTPEQVLSTGALIVLSNTYHLYLSPGSEVVKESGGLHSFMNWNGPILTDSGGFQVFSLSNQFCFLLVVLFQNPQGCIQRFLFPLNYRYY